MPQSPGRERLPFSDNIQIDKTPFVCFAYQFRFDYSTHNIASSFSRLHNRWKIASNKKKNTKKGPIMPSLGDFAFRISFRRKNKPLATASSASRFETTAVAIPTTPPPSSDDESNTPSNAVRRVSLISAQHYDRLIAELRCPGCARPLTAPIRLCQSGHSVCSVCLCRARACPLCARPLAAAARSLALEQLAARAVFECSHAAQGCGVRLRAAALREHEQRCVYKLGDCFMGRVWGGCSWVGRELDWLAHCEVAHAERIFEDRGVVEGRGVERVLRWEYPTYEEKPKKLASYYIFRIYGE